MTDEKETENNAVLTFKHDSGDGVIMKFKCMTIYEFDDFINAIQHLFNSRGFPTKSDITVNEWPKKEETDG